MAMVDGSFSDSSAPVDKRILREEYRNYDLVARYWEYGYLGKIWKGRKAVEEIDASDNQSLDDLMSEMRGMVDSLIATKSRQRKNRPPSQSELIDALKAVSDKLTPLEKLLLKTHAEENTGEIEMSKIQRGLNLSSAESIFELYGRIGQKLNDEVGYQPRAVKGQNVNLKYVVEVSGKGASQSLKLPEAIQLFVLGQAW